MIIEIYGAVIIEGVEYEDDDIMKIVDKYPNGIGDLPWRFAGDIDQGNGDISVTMRLTDHEDSPDDGDNFSGPNTINDFIEYIKYLREEYA